MSTIALELRLPVLSSGNYGPAGWRRGEPEHVFGKTFPQIRRTRCAFASLGRGHVGTEVHNAVGCTPLSVLIVSRESMARNSFSPPTRAFEAAGAGAWITLAGSL